MVVLGGPVRQKVRAGARNGRGAVDLMRRGPLLCGGLGVWLRG